MIESIYTDALLAAAAYADWGLLGTPRESEIKAELINRGFTEEQVNDFFFGESPKYEVHNGVSTGYIDLGNGFSATIFEEIVSGDLTVAYRGTNDPVDWVTNFETLLRKGDRFIFDIGMTRRDDNAKAGKNNIKAYAASYCAAWT